MCWCGWGHYSLERYISGLTFSCQTDGLTLSQSTIWWCSICCWIHCLVFEGVSELHLITFLPLCLTFGVKFTSWKAVFCLWQTCPHLWLNCPLLFVCMCGDKPLKQSLHRTCWSHLCNLFVTAHASTLKLTVARAFSRSWDENQLVVTWKRATCRWSSFQWNDLVQITEIFL